MLVDNDTAQKFAKGFTGHVQTGASGIIDMQYRKMLPTWGRFTSPDPGWDQNPEDPQSWNLNSYVKNNPVMRVDPDGRNDVQVDAYLRNLRHAAEARRNAAKAVPKVEDLSKGDLKKIRTTTEIGGVKTVRTVTEGHGHDASVKGVSYCAGKKTEVARTVDLLPGILTGTITTKTSPGEIETTAGIKGLGVAFGAADKGPNASVGMKLTLDFFGGIDLVTSSVSLTTGSQLGANGGYSPDKGLGGGFKAALGGGGSFDFGVLNLFKKGAGTATEKIEIK